MTKEEFESCIDEYSKDVYSFCMYLTGNVEEGEELCQDTYLKAYERLDKIELGNNPKSYLLSVAIRVWKNKRRKAAWRMRIARIDSMDEMQDAGDVSEKQGIATNLPEQQMLSKEVKEYVQALIRTLPEKYRFVIYLYYTEELSLKEIAICLNLPEGTVKSRLHKAKKIMKERLEVAGYDR